MAISHRSSRGQLKTRFRRRGPARHARNPSSVSREASLVPHVLHVSRSMFHGPYTVTFRKAEVILQIQVCIGGMEAMSMMNYVRGLWGIVGIGLFTVPVVVGLERQISR
jgi:hypothetical protein